MKWKMKTARRLWIWANSIQHKIIVECRSGPLKPYRPNSLQSRPAWWAIAGRWSPPVIYSWRRRMCLLLGVRLQTCDDQEQQKTQNTKRLLRSLYRQYHDCEFGLLEPYRPNFSHDVLRGGRLRMGWHHLWYTAASFDFWKSNWKKVLRFLSRSRIMYSAWSSCINNNLPSKHWLKIWPLDATSFPSDIHYIRKFIILKENK